MRPKPRPLWRCPMCGERFVTKSLWHSCGKYSLETLFARSDPSALRLFRKFERIVRACGPVRTIPQKTRVVFQARIRFAGCMPRKSSLLCTLLLLKRHEHPRFSKVISYTPRHHAHEIRIASEKDLDAQFKRWAREAYSVGQQKHLE